MTLSRLAFVAAGAFWTAAAVAAMSGCVCPRAETSLVVPADPPAEICLRDNYGRFTDCTPVTVPIVPEREPAETILIEWGAP